MERFRKWLSPVLAFLLFFAFIPAVSPAQASTPSFYSLDNDKLRFGNGGENSVNGNGLLQQPFYKNGASWFQLTFSNYAMDSAIGVGGTGTGTWNTSGSVFGTMTNDYGVTGLSVDYSGFVQTAAVGAGAKGYGTVISTGNITKTVSGTTYNMQVKTTYELGQTASFIKITTSIKNIGSTNLVNLRTWVGTRDDFVGGADTTTKTRGTIDTANGFVAATAAGSRNPAIRISSGSEAVIFFSPYSAANTSINGCCNFANAYNQNPATSSLALTNDGSYSLFVPMAELAPNNSEEFSWYYAAGSTAAIATVVNQVAQAAASWDDQTIVTTALNGSSYADQVSAGGTGTITYAVTNGYSLPPGLTLNTSSGAITGTPTTNGNYTFRITATSVSGSTSSTVTTPDLALTVGQSPALASNTLTETMQLGQSYSASVTASGFPAPTYSLASGSLPAGLTLNSSTGAITGTPNTMANYSFAIRATNVFAPSGVTLVTTSASVTAAPIYTDSAVNPRGSIGVAYSSEVLATGSPAPTYSISSGALPNGLALNSATGQITGTPTATGDFSFVVTATNTYGSSSTNSLSIQIGVGPAVSIDQMPQRGFVGVPISISTTSSGFPTPTFTLNSGTLPPGVTLNAQTGTLSGSPTTAGSYTFTLLATNWVGASASLSYSITIHAAPSITNAASINQTINFGDAYSETLTVSGPWSLGYRINTGSLPEGITLDAATGTISGVAESFGRFDFAVSAENESGWGQSTSMTIFVNRAPTLVPSILDSQVMVSDSYLAQFTAIAYPAATYSVGSGALPSGLSLNASTGELSGTVSAPGLYKFTVVATNAAGSETSNEFEVLVASVPSATKTTITAEVALGANYSDSIAFESYPTPTYELADGTSLPDGLSLNANTGAITGTATKMGRFNFAIVATHAYAESAPLDLEIEVLKAPTLVSKSVDGQIMVDSEFSGLVKVNSYPAAEYSIKSGELPPGVSLNTGTGALYGTATSPGEYKFTIRASNRVGYYDFTQATITVGEEPKVLSARTIEITKGAEFAEDISIEAYPTPEYTILSGSLPFGLTLTQNGSLEGAPLQAGQFQFKVRAQSWAGITDSETITLEVLSAPTIEVAQMATQVVVASAFEGEVSSAAYPAASYSLASGALPSGVTLNSVTGELSGQPTEVGEFDFVLRATNKVGHDDTEPVTLLVGEIPAQIESRSLETNRGASFSAEFEIEAFPTPSYSLASGALPAGMLLSSAGVLTGSPTEQGKFTFTISASSWAGTTQSEVITFEVNSAPELKDAIVDNQVSLASEYSAAVSVESYPAATYELASGSLPGGVTLNATTGQLSGFTSQSGTFEFVVRAVNELGTFTFDQFTIMVGAKPGDFSNLGPFELRKGVSYKADYSVPAVPTPKYSLASGSLPTGLQLLENGQIEGTPTAAGIFEFKIEAKSWAGTTVSETIRLEVLAPPASVTSNLPSEIGKGTAVNFGFESDGFPSATFKISEGALPPGLTLDESTGRITGAATSLGTFSFGILVSNKVGSLDAGNFTIRVENAPQVEPLNLPSRVKLGQGFTQAIAFTGFPVPTVTVKSGALPAGIKLNSDGTFSGAATSTGEYSFTISVGNRLGSSVSTHKVVVTESPTLEALGTSTMKVGDAFTLAMQAGGYPAPTLSLIGKLPAGLSFSAASATISGKATESGTFDLTARATNSFGEVTERSFSIVVEAEGALSRQISLKAELGSPIAGSNVEIQAEGVKSGASYIVELHSDPIVLDEGVVPDIGALLLNATIPEGLEPGWHRIELRTTGADNSAVVDVVYFEVTASGLLETLPQDTPPTQEEVDTALTDDAAFLAELGIDPASLVPQEVAQEQTENVVTVVAALSLVAGATAAAASVSAISGGSAPAPARSPIAPATGAATSSSSSTSNTRTGGGPSGGGPSGGGGAGGSGGAPGGKDGDGGSDEESSDAGYGNIEGDLDDFTDERSGWGDRLAIWKSAWMTAADHIYFKLAHVLSKFSPVAGKVANDGSYLTAMTGVFSVLPTLAAGILGVLAVSSNEPSIYTSASVVLITVIIALGTIDALAGFVGMLAVIVTSLSYYGFTDGGVGRYLLTLAMLGFGPIILSTAFRKIRRNKIENLSGIWERITDLAIIFFISYLTTTSLVGAVSALAGASVSISEHSQSIGLMVAAIATIRVLLEELAAAGFTARLEHINPTEVDGPSKLQTWFSLLVKYSVLCYMLAPIVGSGWQLWVGAFVIFFPSLVGQFDLQLPTSKFVWQIIPSGLVALTIASLIAGWSGTLVEMLFGNLENFKDLSFVLSPIPVIAVSLLAMFAEPSKRFYEKLGGSKIIYVIGGIAIYFWTLDVSGFWAALGG